MSSAKNLKEQSAEEKISNEAEKSMPSLYQQEEAALKKKYGGLMPKKPSLLSKKNERAYFDSADWVLGEPQDHVVKPLFEALRLKLHPTHKQTRYRKSAFAPSEGSEDGGASQAEGVSGNQD